MQAPGQVQRGSGEGSEGWEALVRSQVRFNRVPEKVPGSLGAKPSQVQRVPEKVAEKVPEKFVFLLFVFLGFAARFRKICKNKTLRLLGIPPKLIFPFSWEFSSSQLTKSIIFQRGRNTPPTRIIYGQFTNLYGILGNVWDHEWNKNTKSIDLLRIHI